MRPSVRFNVVNCSALLGRQRFECLQIVVIFFVFRLFIIVTGKNGKCALLRNLGFVGRETIFVIKSYREIVIFN